MKTLILSNRSAAVEDLAALTTSNQLDYASKHGYSYENVVMEYIPENFIKWLDHLTMRLDVFDLVMTIGHDVLFMNQRIKIEDNIGWLPNGSRSMDDKRVILAKEHISWWPINNDVMIWPKGDESAALLKKLIDDAPIWQKYPWLWQSHLWDLMRTGYARYIRVVEAREMNSTFQPYIIAANGQAQRIPGPSSYQFGDWILHVLDMPLEMRIKVVKAFLPFAGNAIYAELPKEIREKQ